MKMPVYFKLIIIYIALLLLCGSPVLADTPHSQKNDEKFGLAPETIFPTRKGKDAKFIDKFRAIIKKAARKDDFFVTDLKTNEPKRLYLIDSTKLSGRERKIFAEGLEEWFRYKNVLVNEDEIIENIISMMNNPLESRMSIIRFMRAQEDFMNKARERMAKTGEDKLFAEIMSEEVRKDKWSYLTRLLEQGKGFFNQKLQRVEVPDLNSAIDGTRLTGVSN